MYKLFTSLFLVVSFLYSEDLTLSLAYDKMLRFESSLMSKKNILDSKKEDIAQAQSKLYPQIEAKASIMESKREVNRYKVDEIERNKNYSLYVSQAIFHPEYYSAIKKSKYAVQYESFVYEEHKQKVTLDLIDTYVKLLKIKNSIELRKDYLKNSEYKLSLAKKQFEKQMIDKIVYLESKVDFNQKNIDYQNELNNYILFENKLKSLIGMQGNVNLVYLNNDNTVLNESFLENDIKNILMQNAQYLMSKINIEIAKNELSSAKLQYYPKVDLNLSYTNYDPNDNFSTDYENIATATLDFKMQLFNGGVTNALVRKNRLVLKSYENEMQDTMNKISVEFEQSKIKFNSYKDNIMLLKESISSAELYYESVQKAYEKGLKSIIDLSEAKMKLSEAKYQYFDNYYSYLYEYSNLMYIKGILDSEIIIELNNKL